MLMGTGRVGRQTPAGSALLPSLDLNLISGGALDTRVTFTRASKRTIFDNTGTMQELASNVPGFDFDPVTLLPRGLLIEEQRTNSIRNPRAEGAVVGTPGTLPTNWVVTNAVGLTSAVTGFGSENGVPYVDLRFNGTSTGTAITFITESFGVIAAAQNSVWAHSAYFRLVAGTLANVGLVELDLQSANAGLSTLSTYTASTYTVSNAALSAQRTSGVVTVTDATVASVRTRVAVNVTNGAAIDFTLRIGAPQLELGAFATSVILPPAGTPAAATRAADVATMPVGSWFNASVGSFAAEFMVPYAVGAVGTNPVILELDDGTTANAITMRLQAGISTIDSHYFSSNAGSGAITPAQTISANVVQKVASSFAATLISSSVNGATVATSATGTPVTVYPTGLNRLSIGSGRTSTLSGWIRRVRYWPRALSSAELQQVTT